MQDERGQSREGCRECDQDRAAGWMRRGQVRKPLGVPSLPAKVTSQSKAPTLAILLLLSAVRNDMLLISFWTTKFCSSRLKFWWQRQYWGQSGCGEGTSGQQLLRYEEEQGASRDSRGTCTSR